MKMRRLDRRLKLMALSLVLTGSLGCAAHRQPASQEFYKLAEVDSQYFLLPPGSAWSQQAHQTIQLPIRYDGNRMPENQCSIHGKWFSLYPAQYQGTAYWSAETPLAETWAQNGGYVDMKGEWSRFLGELSARQRCFGSPDELAMVEQGMVANMALPADESLFYRYSYGPGGYVDLAPGMELRIERNLFAKEEGDLQNRENYRGTITTYYSVVHNADQRTQLKLLHSEGDYKKFSTSVANLPDTTLASRFKESSHLRLLLQSLVVSGNIKSPAILLGGREIQSLNEATRIMVSDPKATCADLDPSQVDCVNFQGVVTVSAMLNVVVNGHTTYIPLGSRAWYVFPHSLNSLQSDIVKTLRIRRRFEGRYIDVQFARNEQDVGQILLFGGDEISWSKAAAHH